MSTKKATTKVVQNPEKPVAAELLAQSIVDVAEGMRRINASRLNRKALITLLANATGLARGTCEAVLDSLETLEQTYLKKEGTR